MKIRAVRKSLADTTENLRGFGIADRDSHGLFSAVPIQPETASQRAGKCARSPLRAAAPANPGTGGKFMMEY